MGMNLFFGPTFFSSSVGYTTLGAMSEEVTYRFIEPGEEEQVCGLVIRSFMQFVAPEYSQEGRDEFLKYVTAEAMEMRLKEDHFVLAAAVGKRIVGVIEMRENDHVAMLFVARKAHRRGIGKELWHRALAVCRENRPDLSRVTVHSSRYAVPVYEKFGFRSEGPEQTVNGILYFPMAFEVAPENGDA